MTEAAHQMASNPLPPGRAQARLGRAGHRRARSASWTPRASICQPGERGEVVIQGAERRSTATRTTPRPTPRRSSTAGSAPATRASSTPTATDAGRPHQGADQPRRREDLAARDRRGAARASRRGRGGVPSACRTRPGARRSRRRSCCATRPPSAELLAYCKERLADFKRPKQIHITDADPAHRHRQDSAARRRRRRSLRDGVKIVIAGAGAIGGYIGAQLARAGADVVLFARGPHLAGDAGARPARRQRRRRLRGPAAGHRRSRDDRHGRRRLPRRQGARPDRAGAAAAARCSVPTRSSSARRTGSRGGTSRATAASSTACASSASIPAA